MQLRRLYRRLGPLAAPLRRKDQRRRRLAARSRREAIRRMERHRAANPERTQMLSLAELRAGGVVR